MALEHNDLLQGSHVIGTRPDRTKANSRTVSAKRPRHGQQLRRGRESGQNPLCFQCANLPSGAGRSNVKLTSDTNEAPTWWDAKPLDKSARKLARAGFDVK